MLIGAHSILYSTDADADRAFLRDVLELPGVDVGGGWLIFGLPPAEVAVHPGEENDVHEFYLMCDDVAAFIDQMKKKGVACGPVHDQPWGRLTQLTLPGGGKLGVYEPRHARPQPMAARRPAKKDGRARGKKTGPRRRAAKAKAPSKPAAGKGARKASRR